MLLIAQCLVAESIVEGEEGGGGWKGRRGAATAIKAGCKRRRRQKERVMKGACWAERRGV